MKTSPFNHTFISAADDDKVRLSKDIARFPCKKEDGRELLWTEQVGYSAGVKGGVMGGVCSGGEKGCINCSGLGSG